MANGTELETNKNICVGFFVTQISQMTQIFLGTFFSHADFADDADFFHHRTTRNFAEATCSVVADIPLGLDKAIH